MRVEDARTCVAGAVQNFVRSALALVEIVV